MRTPAIRSHRIGATRPLGAVVGGLLAAVFVQPTTLAADDPSPAAPDRFDRLIERGWWGDAREACRAEAVPDAKDDERAGRLARIDALENEAERVRARAFDWLRDPGAWRIRWSRPVAAGVTAEVASLIVWAKEGGVHGVLLANGLPAWRVGPPSDTRLFPRVVVNRGVAGSARAPGVVATVGHLLYTVIDAGADEPLLACIDCSEAAQGRLLWSAAPAAGLAEFDGPPAADHELCMIVARATASSGPLELVAHDARDGSVVWRRPLGTAIARDGIDHARGIRVASFHESLVMTADHAGSVWAFDRSGRPVWRHAYRVAASAVRAAAEEPTDSAEPVVAIGQTVIVAPRDRGGIIGLSRCAPDRPLFETSPDGVRIVGATGERVVLAPRSFADGDRLTAIAVADGRPLASEHATVVPVGPAVMAGSTILRPTRGAGGAGISIAAIDPATLRPMHSGFPIPGDWPDDSGEPVLRLAAGRDTLVMTGSRTMVCIEPVSR